MTEDSYAGDPNDPQELNRYAYVKGNPLKYIDPDGHRQVIGDDPSRERPSKEDGTIVPPAKPNTGGSSSEDSGSGNENSEPGGNGSAPNYNKPKVANWTDPLKNMWLRLRQGGDVDPISNIFGWVRTDDKGKPKPHQGVDLYAYAPVGTPVFAVADGEIIAYAKTGNNGNLGSYILLRFKTEDGEVKYALYAHLSEVDVPKDGKIKSGTVIGKTGRTGNAINVPEDESHLHFEIWNTLTPGRKNLEGREDPTLYFKRDIIKDIIGPVPEDRAKKP